MKRRLAAAAVVLAMVLPKILDEVSDVLDDDPATVFSWRFLLSLLSGPLAAFLIGTAPGRQRAEPEPSTPDV